MDIMTKVRVLWEKVAGITADVSAVDAKATATAATLAGILPRIPGDYSDTGEVNTGQKWIDGKDIYCKAFSGILGQTTTEEELATNINCDSLISCLWTQYDGNEYQVNKGGLRVYSSGNITVRPYTAAYTGKNFWGYVTYTKPDPVPAQADNETKKRKTTKKEEK